MFVWTRVEHCSEEDEYEDLAEFSVKYTQLGSSLH